MPVTVVVGAQWGDEAKGKIVDILAQNADIVARYNGGDNAGHTVVNPHGTFKVRLTPNGFSSPNTVCAIGAGVVINLATLIEELEFIESKRIRLAERYWISPRCNLVMPYHPLLESIYEEVKGGGRTGTTRRGMGPVHADRASYNGICLADLFDERVFAEKLGVQLAIKNPILAAFGLPPLDFQEVYQEKLRQFERVRGMLREPFGLIQEGLSKGSGIVLEGAQGTFLDNTWGTYPFVTASTTLSGGAAAGLGIAPRWIERAIGVAKAYTTRVGAGPMPTELLDETGELIRREGQEFGTVTGRARRCGWFDAALVRFAVQVNGFSEIALTKLDVLDSLPVLRLCAGYRPAPGAERPYEYWEGDARWLEGCQPVYVEMEGWMESTRRARRFDELPPRAQAYVHKVEELAGAPVTLVSVGPERSETIFR